MDSRRLEARALKLHEALQREPYRFDFFHALRLLECVHADRARLGRSERALQDPVRLGQVPLLSFAPSTLAAFEPGQEGRAPRLLVFFLGLLGPSGPLPLHLTDFTADRIRSEGDRALARFLDVFHHRMLSFFYRAWADANPVVQLDRPSTDRFAIHVGSLAGMGLPSLRHVDARIDATKLHYAGWFAIPTRPAAGLRAMLEGFFELPVRIEELVGRWIELPEQDRCRLGGPPESAALGRTTVAGTRAWVCAHTFRIVFGPLGFADYQRLLPGREALRQLSALVLGYAGREFAWELKLILHKDEVPELRLGGPGELGRTTWFRTRPRTHDAEVALEPGAAAA